MEWLQKGTHEKHLSVYEYERKMRKAEVEELEQEISSQKDIIADQSLILETNETALVDQPDKVTVTEKETADAVVLELHVAEGDMGKVIGKQGRIAKAIRTVVKASVDKGDKKIVVDIQQKIKSSQESVQKMYKTVGFLLCINSRK